MERTRIDSEIRFKLFMKSEKINMKIIRQFRNFFDSFPVAFHEWIKSFKIRNFLSTYIKSRDFVVS